MDQNVVLSTRGLTKSFAGLSVLKGIDFAVRRGSVHALIGPNGAGKTTFFNLLSGFLKPSTGEIWFNGTNIAGYSPEKIARAGIVRSFQISAVFNNLTVLENLRIALLRALGKSLHFWKSESVVRRMDERALDLAHSVGLKGCIEDEVATLPYGHKRALEIAMALAVDPELLLLDEPTAGMGAEAVEAITNLIQQVAKSRTIIMVEHNLKVVENLCDHVSVLHYGKLLFEGSYADAARDPLVVEAYMGSATGPELALRAPVNAKAARGPAHEVLKASELDAWYGPSQALHKVEFHLHKGEVVTLLGRNGAGKTTILKAVMGLVRRSGAVRLFDQEIGAFAPHQIAAAGIGYCPEERGIFPDLSVLENLLLPPPLPGGGLPISQLMALFPSLEARLTSRGGWLSGGEQQMLAIARLLRTGAQVLLLDEPGEGLAPSIVKQIATLILELKALGMTILLVEQNLWLAAQVADRHYIVENGRIIDCVGAAELGTQWARVSRHLGL